MYIKLNDSIVNLDLIKSIDKLTAYLNHNDHSSASHHPIKDDELERWLDISVNGNESQREYTVLYGVSINYLNEKFPTVVMVGKDKENAERVREELAVLLNNNQPLIHEIKL